MLWRFCHFNSKPIFCYKTERNPFATGFPYNFGEKLYDCYFLFYSRLQPKCVPKLVFATLILRLTCLCVVAHFFMYE